MNAPEERTSIEVGVVASPGVAADLVEPVAAELCGDLAERYPRFDWRATSSVDRLVAPPAALVDILGAVRSRLLDEDWDLALAVTDQPLRVGGRPVPDYSSPTHRVGVVSVPALGPVAVRRRLRSALLEQIGELLVAARRDDDPGRTARIAPPERVDEPRGPRYAVGVALANVRLLAGMVRANRPWRFALRLYRMLVTALAAAVFALVTAEVWQLADALDWPRLLVGTLVSVLVTAAAVIGAHGLWERAPNRRVRPDVILFNLATAITVAIGIVTLYLALFGIAFGAASLIVDEGVLEATIGHDAGVRAYLFLAWLLASIGALGGALGAGLESGEAIREAAYAPAEDEEEPA